MTEIELVGIDADDTLWQSETFFAEVEEKFIELMSKYSSDTSLEAVSYTHLRAHET